MRVSLRVLAFILPALFFSHCEWLGTEDPINNEPVDIPDRAFLYDLITLGIDTNGDSIISYSEAEAATSLDITNFYGNYISDITGIEAFKNLSSLIFRCNVIVELDLSNNTVLKQLIVFDNALQNIDVSNCIELEELHVGSEGYCEKNNHSYPYF